MHRFYGDSLAQLVEHNTFNVGVLGSSPKRITLKKSQETIDQFLVIFFCACTTQPLYEGEQRWDCMISVVGNLKDCYGKKKSSASRRGLLN